ncbi:hypothetical protein [Aromatoleum aromaticum]|jgi:hypothetical protein|uniref:Uncharacterized protein n=1 Tax=Aromatoleum aromaticum (strain DSM 19018 / LMG 30748 / EbN1) TaxID=76114 RepID=Q5NWQ2_AROAE|nr:hypothetical protein [Aromatoleum aromaticum]CAI10512.1 hypothetical protein p1B354 [Aromatoleum aromaticum EbN1]
MSYVARKYFVLPADREEVKRAISMFMLAKSDARASYREIEAYGAAGMYFVPGKGWGMSFKERPKTAKVEGLGKFTFFEKEEAWVAIPDKRTAAGKKLEELLQNTAELQEIWQWSLEKSLGIYGVVACGFPTTFHYCCAKPLFDGRVIVSTPDAKNRPTGSGYSRNFEDPVIPGWAVEISADAYEALNALPEFGRENAEAA